MFSWFKREHPKLRELASLPDEIAVVHAPNPVGAIEEKDAQQNTTYRWVYRTTVWTKKDPLRVIEFGSFSWHRGQWAFANFTGKPFTPEDFADWYSCPEGQLHPAEGATDPSNWTGGQRSLRAGKMLWYFIGLDQDGRRVKGEAVVELLADIG